MPSTEPIAERAVIERPILFSGPMVRAILENRKNQTRRMMKSQPYTLRVEGFGYPTKAGGFVSIHSPHCLAECPYGVAGDRLWVRETFHWSESHEPIYRACIDPALEGIVNHFRVKHGEPWRPSIFMPRWASRLLLEVTEVRAQRLQEISTEDCIAECLRTNLRESEACDDLRDQYRALWDSINGKRWPWKSNPWVWAITFKKIA